MKKWKTVGVIAALLAAAFVALACTETTVQPSADGATSGINVSGSGSVFGEPDVAILSLGVEAEADSVGEAREQAAGSMDAMLNALRNGGVEDDDIQTSRFSVQPRYDFQEGRQELIGFVVNNLVTVKIRSIDDTGDLIDAAVAAGGDLSRVDNLRFTIDDPTALEDEARQLAMEDAKSKADTLAEAGGVDLGSPISISESGGVLPDVFRGDFFAEAVQDAGGTPIETGELEVQVQVQVLYALE